MSAHQATAASIGTREAGAGLGLGLSARATARVGWALFALATVSAGAGLLLLQASGSTAARGHGGVPAMAVVFPVFAGVGALILSRRPGNVLGWLLSLEGASAALFANGLGYGYVHLAAFGHTGGWPAGGWVAWLTQIVNDVGFSLGFLLLLLFPTGRPPSPRWWPVVWGGVSLAVLAGLADTLKPGPMDFFPDLSNPAGASGALGSLASAVSNTVQAGVLVCWLAAVGSVFGRLRTTRGVERQQLKWFAYAASLLAAGVVFAIGAPVWLPVLGLDPSHVPGPVAFVINVLWPLAVVAIPVSIGVAILRYRLYDIDLLINRTLVYGALVATILGIYVLVVGYSGLLFQARGDLASLLAAGLAAVLFQPLRERLQVGVNRLLYGQRDEPYTVLSRLGQRLETALAPEAMLPTIVETVREALKLPYVALAVRSAEGEQLAAHAGMPTAVALRVELPYQQDVVGALLLGARGPGETFSSADHRLLEDLARQAGVAVHAATLTVELQRARERLVAAREEERRRLHRDLHDDLGPLLASLGLQLAAVRNALGHEPALQMRVAALKQQTQAAVENVRRLVDGLRPPALDELGLVEALAQLAAGWSELAAGPRVALEAPTRLPALPAAVEVAAYRIASEALTNSLRHAGATACAVRLTVLEEDEPAWLEIEVADDGTGFGPGRRRGTGVRSMHERAEELGGTCVVEARPGGGTLVVARLPLAQGT